MFHDQIRRLILDRVIDCNWSSDLEAKRPLDSKQADFDRVRGMLLGLAIGDALGNTSEGMLPAHRNQTYGEIRNYLPNRCAEYREVGVPSDDSQMAFWTVEHLLEHGRLVPEALIDTFPSRQIFGMGQSVAGTLARYHVPPVSAYWGK